MEVILKQRLIGAAVIIALAVVLIPMILDSAGKHERAGIPESPGYVTTHKPGQIRIVHTSVPKPGKFNPADFSYAGRSNRADRAVRSAKDVVVPAASKRKVIKRVAKAPVAKSRRNDANRYIAKGRTGSKKLKPVTRLDLSRSSRPKRAQPGGQPTARPNVRNRTAKNNTVKKQIIKQKTNNGIAATPSAGISGVTRAKQASHQAAQTWTVQVASFRNRNNAYLLKARLHKAGFRAYIQRLESKNRKSVYRVRVGPEKNHHKAKEIRARLRREVRMNGYVTKY